MLCCAVPIISGTPAALISVLLEPKVGLGCYSTCFPLLLLAAEVATQPSGHVGTQVTASVTRTVAPPPKTSDAATAATHASSTEGDTGGLPMLRSVLPLVPLLPLSA